MVAAGSSLLLPWDDFVGVMVIMLLMLVVRSGALVAWVIFRGNAACVYGNSVFYYLL